MSIVKLNNRGIRSATAVGTTTQLGDMVFIKKLTASSSADLSFVDGSASVVLDNTHKEYIFTFKNIHPATDGAEFQFNLSVDGGSNYNVTKTTTMFYSYQTENGASTSLAYDGNLDLAQSSSDQLIMENLGNGNDENGAGYLHLFDPSSTTFLKHFLSRGIRNGSADYCVDYYMGGYGNTTSAINAVQFKMSSGNLDAGDICLYGIN